MRLSTELAKPWQPPKLRLPARLEIERIAQSLMQQYGGVAHESPPPRDYLDETERLLVEGGGDLSRLTRRHRKALPWILWTSRSGWSERERLVTDYLDWADQEWRVAPKRLWRHYLLNLNPESLATQKVARWLQTHQARLPEALRGFSEQWHLFDPKAAIEQTAQALLEGEALLEALDALNLPRAEVLQSALMLRVLRALGERLTLEPRPSTNVAAYLKKLLAPLGSRPTYQMQVQALRAPTEKALVEGIVPWADAVGQVESTLDLLNFLIGDPRLHPSRWTGIDPAITQTVEGWLTRITLDAFFRVMLEFHTDRNDMVRERERFWRGYQHAITRAWLVVADGGIALAQRLLGQSFARFNSGTNVQRDHCGLMLQLGSLTIFEMNKNGKTLLWLPNEASVPKFFEKQYSRTAMYCRRAMTHHYGSWQDKYEREIHELTGIRRRG